MAMKKIINLGILLGVLALSAGYLSRQADPMGKLSFKVNTQENYCTDQSVEHRFSSYCDENLLNSEEEDESLKPLAHLFSAGRHICITLKIFHFPRILHPAAQDRILFEADSSPPSPIFS